jgi:hypothetical protein
VSRDAGDTRRFVPPPRRLPAFPDALPVKPKTPVQGGGGLRPRWRDAKGRIYEWDKRHGTVEVYDKTGKRHRGEFDPVSGKRLGPGDPRRKVEP